MVDLGLGIGWISMLCYAMFFSTWVEIIECVIL